MAEEAIERVPGTQTVVVTNGGDKRHVAAAWAK